jgi:hypothetical protein
LSFFWRTSMRGVPSWPQALNQRTKYQGGGARSTPRRPGQCLHFIRTPRPIVPCRACGVLHARRSFGRLHEYSYTQLRGPALPSTQLRIPHGRIIERCGYRLHKWVWAACAHAKPPLRSRSQITKWDLLWAFPLGFAGHPAPRGYPAACAPVCGRSGPDITTCSSECAHFVCFWGGGGASEKHGTG